jgi:hypothetical protein
VIGGDAALPPPIKQSFPQTYSIIIFEITILFSVVERSRNYVLEDNSPLHITLRSRVVSYALGAYKVFIEMVVV